MVLSHNDYTLRQPHVPTRNCAVVFLGGAQMKLVYIASPLRGDHEKNIKAAVEYCQNTCDMGVLALAPHIIFSQWCNDSVPELREKGLKLGLELLSKADELWVMGERISQGMAGEIAYAKKHGIPIFSVEQPHDLNLYPVSLDRNLLLGAHSCLPDSKGGQLEGKTVVLRYDKLKPEHRTPINQLWFATHGNGCRPNAIGRSIFLTHVMDGDKMVAYREDLCGVAKPEVYEHVKSLYEPALNNDIPLEAEGMDR